MDGIQVSAPMVELSALLKSKTVYFVEIIKRENKIRKVFSYSLSFFMQGRGVDSTALSPSFIISKSNQDEKFFFTEFNKIE